MKIKYFIISILILGLAACKKGDSYDLSKVTVFAEFEYEADVVVPLNGTFTPNATAKEGDKTLDVTTTGSVDASTVGVYTVTYSATNSEGYDGTATQTVVVHDPSLTGTDVSGNINDMNRTERTAVISLVEGTNNIYYCTDMAFGGVFPLYFQMVGDEMQIINQPFIFGVTEVTGEYDPATRTFHILIVDYGFAYDFEYSN